MPNLLSIGELAKRTGVAATALRYYDQLGLVRPSSRESGRRRYDETAVAQVGVILLLRDVGFSLAEVKELLQQRRDRQRGWAEFIDRKLHELDEQQARLDVARVALEHGKSCPAGDPTRCQRFWSIVNARVEGRSLQESHAAAHR